MKFDPITLLLLLIAAHALADFPLQGEKLSAWKRPETCERVCRHAYLVAIFYHATIHGALVLAVTGSSVCMGITTVSHFLIDLEKSTGRQRSEVVDQSSHAVFILIVWILACYLNQ